MLQNGLRGKEAAMKCKTLLTLALSIVLVVLVQREGQGEPSELKTGDVATFGLPGGAMMDMIWIEPGTFTMGSPEGEVGRYYNRCHA